eukprot:6815417-Pyramimonas_sp.AAC.1
MGQGAPRTGRSLAPPGPEGGSRVRDPGRPSCVAPPPAGRNTETKRSPLAKRPSKYRPGHLCPRGPTKILSDDAQLPR